MSTSSLRAVSTSPREEGLRHRYALLVPSGLEREAASLVRKAAWSSDVDLGDAELRFARPPVCAKGGALGQAGAHSALLLESAAPLPAAILGCSCVATALALVARGEVCTASATAALADGFLERPALAAALATLRAHAGAAPPAGSASPTTTTTTTTTFRVATVRGGRHAPAVTSCALSSAVADEIVDRARPGSAFASWRVDLEAPQVLVLCILAQASLLVGMVLPPFRPHRSRAVPETPRAWLPDRSRPHMDPSRAAALVELARIALGEVFLDPCGGIGTLAIEAVSAVPALRRAISLDLDEAASAACVANASRAAAAATTATAAVEARVGDARATGLAPNSVDVVLCDLPFGRRHVRLDVGAVLRELWRVVRVGGRAVLVFADVKKLRRAAGRNGTWDVEAVVPFASGGIPVAAFVLRRLCTA
jgi:SAM-dependent methyltransferase